MRELIMKGKMAIKDGWKDRRMGVKDRVKYIAIEGVRRGFLKRKDAPGYARVCHGYATNGYKDEL